MYGTLISSVTVGAGGAANITFSSIPGTYTDLVVVYSGRSSGNDTDFQIRFNGSTTGYTVRYLAGSGSSAYSGNLTAYSLTAQVSWSATTANTFGSTIITIPNYAGSTNKSWSADSVSENNASTAYQTLYAGVWANTSAITSITLQDIGADNHAQYSTAYLYGLTKGSGGATVS
jgi:hypothetical protein